VEHGQTMKPATRSRITCALSLWWGPAWSFLQRLNSELCSFVQVHEEQEWKQHASSIHTFFKWVLYYSAYTMGLHVRLFVYLATMLFAQTITYTVEQHDNRWIMNWTGFRRKQLFLNLMYYPGISLGRLRKATKPLSRYSRSLRRDLKPGPPK
jgi:hypothetical protein